MHVCGIGGMDEDREEGGQEIVPEKLVDLVGRVREEMAFHMTL